MAQLALPFSETMRPKKLSDLVQPAHIQTALARMIERKLPMNMIFSGPPGLGKTSTADLIAKSMDADVLTYAGSGLKGAMKDTIMEFVTGYSLSPPKICVIEEAEFIPAATQASLRIVIEELAGFCRFILITNSLQKIDPALRSRLEHVPFFILPSQRAEVMKKVMARYETVLAAMKVKYDPAGLAEIIALLFPDLRAIANRVEFDIVLPSEAEPAP